MLIPKAIDDLVEFMRRDDLPALVQIAVAHARFETIHPFVDGNGRTGRALAQTLMHNKGLVTPRASVGAMSTARRISHRVHPNGPSGRK